MDREDRFGYISETAELVEHEERIRCIKVVAVGRVEVVGRTEAAVPWFSTLLLISIILLISIVASLLASLSTSPTI